MVETLARGDTAQICRDSFGLAGSDASLSGPLSRKDHATIIGNLEALADPWPLVLVLDNDSSAWPPSLGVTASGALRIRGHPWTRLDTTVRANGR
jgi:hypothetical protein